MSDGDDGARGAGGGPAGRIRWMGDGAMGAGTGDDGDGATDGGWCGWAGGRAVDDAGGPCLLPGARASGGGLVAALQAVARRRRRR